MTKHQQLKFNIAANINAELQKQNKSYIWLADITNISITKLLNMYEDDDYDIFEISKIECALDMQLIKIL